MKIVFFRQLLLDETTRQWSAAQQIVYSYFLSQSILRLDSVFHADGTNIDFVEVIEEYRDEDGEIDLCDYKIDKMVELLHLSKRNIYDSINFLRSTNYIHDEFIYCPKEIIYHGYFELKIETGLTKQLLIFYSWLCERGQPYNGIIDTFSYKMAETLGTNDVNIRVMLSRLSDKGFVKRISTEDRRYGKIIIK